MFSPMSLPQEARRCDIGQSLLRISLEDIDELCPENTLLPFCEFVFSKIPGGTSFKRCPPTAPLFPPQKESWARFAFAFFFPSPPTGSLAWFLDVPLSLCLSSVDVFPLTAAYSILAAVPSQKLILPPFRLHVFAH